ncbi:MAG: CBS domain-containing protein [Sideroxyarcus sp.]|nr:CBS domain-containing protein [Sideroxyarcus sp.]
MPIGEICNRQVVIVQPDVTVQEASQLMRQHHVGDVLVVEERGGKCIPIGIATDRDLVVEIMAQQLDPSTITMRDIMASDLITIRENAGLYEAIELMHAKGVRRLPVVDEGGTLSGILALDDLIELLADEMTTLAKLVRHEQKKEIAMRR